MTSPLWGSQADFPLRVAPGEDTFLEVTKGSALSSRQSDEGQELNDLLKPSLKSPGWNFREREPIRRHRLGRCELIVVPACYWRLWRRLRTRSDSPTTVRPRSQHESFPTTPTRRSAR